MTLQSKHMKSAKEHIDSLQRCQQMFFPLIHPTGEVRWREQHDLVLTALPKGVDHLPLSRRKSNSQVNQNILHDNVRVAVQWKLSDEGEQ